MHGPHRVCRSVLQKRNADKHVRRWANAGIDALNHLAGVGHSAASTKTNQMQELSLDRIFESYSSVGSPPDTNPAEALSELCAKSGGYHEDGSSTVRPYSKPAVSWPPEGFEPVALDACLRPPDREWFRAWEDHLLRDLAEANSLIHELNIQPYNDPQLKHNSKVYSDFLRELHSRGLLRWRRATKGERGKLGIFFVEKKGGKLRLIFDTRLVNCFFRTPVHTKLPSAGALSSIELPPGDLHISHADIENAFLRM